MPTMQMPEAYIAKVGSLFDESGKPKDKDAREFFSNFTRAFSDWIALITGRAKA